jgi:hypothetical protein
MSEGYSRSTGSGRPRLPPAALERIEEAEKLAVETLRKSVQPYTPANPHFICRPSEIDAGCWKVIDHLMAFAEAIFDIQVSGYATLYPQLVSAGDILVKEIGPEVVNRTKWYWTEWETAVDIALRARWPPEYYTAYLEDANKPGSEDEKLTHHFERQLEEAVAERIAYWQKHSMEPDSSQEIPPIVPTGRKGNKTAVRQEQAPTVGNKGPRSRTEDDRAIHEASTPEVKAPSSGGAADASSQQPPLPPYWDRPDPLFYFETWDLALLSDKQRSEIKAGLLTIHAAFLEGQTSDPPEIQCWRRAYDVLAKRFFAADALTEDLIKDGIPTMVLDASTSGRWMWGRNSCQFASGDICFRFGNEYYPESFVSRYYLLYLEGRLGHWRAKLLLAHGSVDAPAPGETRSAQKGGAALRARDRDKQLSRPSPKEFVDAARRHPKRSYEKFAAQIGIGKDTLYKITKETSWVSDETYALVAEVCNCKPEDLHPRDIPRPEHRRR